MPTKLPDVLVPMIDDWVMEELEGGGRDESSEDDEDDDEEEEATSEGKDEGAGGEVKEEGGAGGVRGGEEVANNNIDVVGVAGVFVAAADAACLGRFCARSAASSRMGVRKSGAE